MFTGIVTTVGCVEGIEPLGEGRRITISAPWSDELSDGESVAVDGVCLTVTDCGSGSFVVEAVRETLKRTIIGSYDVGRRVHLERALALGERLDGHLVQGHVDVVATVQSIEQQGENRYIRLSLPPNGLSLVAAQGSIAVNGVSLTVLEVAQDGVALSIVPYTWSVTAFPDLRPGSEVNVEYDLIARYVKRIMELSE